KVTMRARSKAATAPSPCRWATASGTPISRPKIMMIRPSALKTGKKLRISEEGKSDLEQLLDLPHEVLVRAEHDHVVVLLDHRVVVRHDDLAPDHALVAYLVAHDGADGDAARQRDLLDGLAHHLGFLGTAMGDDLQRLGRAAAQAVHRHHVAAPHVREQGADGD